MDNPTIKVVVIGNTGGGKSMVTNLHGKVPAYCAEMQRYILDERPMTVEFCDTGGQVTLWNVSRYGKCLHLIHWGLNTMATILQNYPMSLW